MGLIESRLDCTLFQFEWVLYSMKYFCLTVAQKLRSCRKIITQIMEILKMALSEKQNQSSINLRNEMAKQWIPFFKNGSHLNKHQPLYSCKIAFEVNGISNG